MVLSPRVTGYDRPLTVKVYDTGDLDDEDVPEVPIGAGYWSQNMQGSPIPDTWAAWRDDFFMPAARLMKTAPWLLGARQPRALQSRRAGLVLSPRSGVGAAGRRQWPAVLLAADPAGLAAGRLAQAAGPAFRGPAVSHRMCDRPCGSSSASSTSSRSIRQTPATPTSTTSRPLSGSSGRSPPCWASDGRPGWSPIGRSGAW